MVLWLVRDITYDAICNMGCPGCIPVESAHRGSVWNDGGKVSRLCIDQIKMLGFQDGLLLGLGTFGCDVLCYGLEQGLKEPIQEDLVVELDFA